jgi:hypothetical protein
MKKISTTCPKCIDGIESITTIVNGEEVVTEITCRTCGGSGLHSSLSLSDELIDKVTDMDGKLDDIKDKADDIIDKLNE